MVTLVKCDLSYLYLEAVNTYTYGSVKKLSIIGTNKEVISFKNIFDAFPRVEWIITTNMIPPKTWIADVCQYQTHRLSALSIEGTPEQIGMLTADEIMPFLKAQHPDFCLTLQIKVKKDKAKHEYVRKLRSSLGNVNLWQVDEKVIITLVEDWYILNF
uniref:Methyltransf_21 domain-containing protein n=1 Tax=Panagrellus redivivus TaxID=6233 RepID=A0A7E4WBL8_PANRE